MMTTRTWKIARTISIRGIDPEPLYNTPAEEQEAAGREIRLQAGGMRHTVKDDAEDGHAGRDGGEDVDPDDIRSEDYETRAEYEEALEDAGIDIEDAAPWEDDGDGYDKFYPVEH